MKKQKAPESKKGSTLIKSIIIMFFTIVVIVAINDSNNSYTNNSQNNINTNIKNESDNPYLEAFCDNEDNLKRIALNKRKVVFKEILSAEDRATAETEAKYPLDSSNPTYWNGNGFLREKYKENSSKYLDLSDELMEKYRSKVLKKYGLSKEEGSKIATEAVCKNWF